ncbi:unnamed protein product [Durusdinium trenchii]|uniref:Uncharacterized protein n=1 Tax=Durusdinium trenchii TaxID=1381693 RepID=A0ABP0PXA2_9DINO
MKCQGLTCCTDPLNCRPALTCVKIGKQKFSFVANWKARRAAINLVANRAQQKIASAEKIAVLFDTTVAKSWWNASLPGGADDRHAQLLRATLMQLCRTSFSEFPGYVFQNMCDILGVQSGAHAPPDDEDSFDEELHSQTKAAVAKLLRKEMLQSDATTSCPASENLTPEMAVQQLEELFDRNANRDEAQVTEIDVPLAWKGPAAYAKSLIDKFPFNQEQLDLLALLVNPLEVAWRNREDTSVYTLPVDLGVDLEFLPPKPCGEHLIFNRHCDQCVSYPGVIQVLSKTQTWSYTLPDEKISLKIKRTAFPLWPEKACSLYTMQGTTASPGLVAHMTLPARSPADIKFLAVYVMLSRPRSFKNLLTLGLNDKIRNIIESGPPEELLETFATLFGSKADETREAAREAAEHLGWQAGG